MQGSRTIGDSDPVVGVSWFESVTYCRWLTKQTGLSEDAQCYEDPSSLPKDGEGNPTNWPLRLEGAVFRLPTEELEKQFVAEALAKDMSGLKGHRSVGGCRASMYNAMPVEGAETLAKFMTEFAKQNG